MWTGRPLQTWTTWQHRPVHSRMQKRHFGGAFVISGLTYGCWVLPLWWQCGNVTAAAYIIASEDVVRYLYCIIHWMSESGKVVMHERAAGAKILKWKCKYSIFAKENPLRTLCKVQFFGWRLRRQVQFSGKVYGPKCQFWQSFRPNTPPPNPPSYSAPVR